ncbi:MAG: 3-oxoacyl-[acyl-carrier-protein] synthase III C-terminal domain-containing protein, partial [Solirubrobacteraceae bacterium]
SVPLALVEAARAGRCRPGGILGLLAIGGGLTWGGLLLRWGDTAVGLDDARLRQEAPTAASALVPPTPGGRA